MRPPYISAGGWGGGTCEEEISLSGDDRFYSFVDALACDGRGTGVTA